MKVGAHDARIKGFFLTLEKKERKDDYVLEKERFMLLKKEDYVKFGTQTRTSNKLGT